MQRGEEGREFLLNDDQGGQTRDVDYDHIINRSTAVRPLLYGIGRGNDHVGLGKHGSIGEVCK